jgi:hypothetical protein
MWDLLEGPPGAPLYEGSAAIDRVMAVTEALGMAGLSPPTVRDVLAERPFRLVSSGAFSQPPNDPTTRLEQLRHRLAGTSFGALEQWSESVLRQAQPRPTGCCPSRTPSRTQIQSTGPLWQLLSRHRRTCHNG